MLAGDLDDRVSLLYVSTMMRSEFADILVPPVPLDFM